MGEYELRVNRALHNRIEKTEAQTKMLTGFAELKEAIIFRKPLPSSASAPGIRTMTPVKWQRIEPKTSVAIGELGHEIRMNAANAKTQTKQLSGKRPTSARPARGKYARMCPPSKSQLRPQSATTRPKDNKQASVPLMLVRNAVPPATIKSVQTNIARIAAAEEDDYSLDEEGLGTFLTQARPIDSCRPVASGQPAYLEPEKTRLEHLEPRRVNAVINSMPLCCDGRLVVSTDVRQVIEKRQAGLKRRVAVHIRKPTRAPEDDVVLHNRDNVQTNEHKLEMLHGRAELMNERLKINSERRERLQKQREQETLENVERHMLAVERRRQLEERLDREDLQRHLLACMMFAFKTSRLRHKIQRWHHHKPSMMRKRWAVLVVEKYYSAYKSHEFSKRRAEALFLLACVFSRCIRAWRERHRGKKAAIIVTYLKEVANFAMIQVAVKRFRIKIVRAQQYIRKSIANNHARYELLELQWNRVDGQRRVSHFAAPPPPSFSLLMTVCLSLSLSLSTSMSMSISMSMSMSMSMSI